VPNTRPLPAHFLNVFGDLVDRRVKRSQRYPMLMLLFFALCATLSGAGDGWDAMAAFTKRKKGWFERFFDFPKRTPCADTFRRVFERLGPKVLGERFPRWLEGWKVELAGQVVSVDGKSVKGTFDQACPTEPLHLLHAFATASGILLGMTRVAGAPGELAGTSELLDLLDLAGSIVTTDANGCTQANAAKIIEAGADYGFGLKGNRGPIFDKTKELFAQAQAAHDPALAPFVDNDKGHGRREQRVTTVLPAERLPQAMRNKWRGLRSLVRIERTRVTAEKTSTEVHYYLSSLPPDAPRLSAVIRAHWGVENNLHFVLDATMGEDDCRVRDRVAAENMAVMRRLALSLLTRPEAGKGSLKMKMREAGWDDDYRLELLLLPTPKTANQAI